MGDHRRKVNMRSGGAKADPSKQFELTDGSIFEPKKTLEQYEKVFGQNTEFFSTYNPDMIEDAIIEALVAQNVEPSKKANDKYKLKFTISNKDQGGTVNTIAMQVRILNVDNKMVCVEFMRLDGDKQRYNEHYLKFKN